MIKILYISLTGMTEPLGRSQVLEYLVELSKVNEVYLISFERSGDLEGVEAVKTLVNNHAIHWHYFVYSNQYGVFSTVGQITQAIRLGSKLISQHAIQIIHARSMIPATIGLLLKKWRGVKLLFDIRGFAIDEKVDSGRLHKNSLLFKLLKKLDDYLYQSSDHIVTLTHAAKQISHEKLNIPLEGITVIPTCASKDVFKLMSVAEKQAFKDSLGYTPKDKLILHTGTVSGWYDFESEVILVKNLMLLNDDIRFLVLNKNEQPFIDSTFEKYDLPKDKIKVMSCSFDEVYQYLNIAAVSLFFIKPSYSKHASAPTKFAENVACHLPSITNSGVGDMRFYLEKYDVGCLVKLDDLAHNRDAIVKKMMPYINHEKLLDTQVYEELFALNFDKQIAVQNYQAIYDGLA